MAYTTLNKMVTVFINNFHIKVNDTIWTRLLARKKPMISWVCSVSWVCMLETNTLNSNNWMHV